MGAVEKAIVARTNKRIGGEGSNRTNGHKQGVKGGRWHISNWNFN